jgi:PAS domain S-box-containing protein
MESTDIVFDVEQEKKDEKKFFIKIHLVIFLTILVYIPVFYFLDASLACYLLIIIAAVMNPIIYLLQFYNFMKLARLTMIVACNMGVFFTSLGLGHQIHSEQYCFCFIILSLLLFNKKNISLLVVSCFTCLLTGWLIFEKFLLFLVASTLPQHAPLKELSILNFLGTSVLMISFVYLFLKDSQKQQMFISKLLGTSHYNFLTLKKREKELKQLTDAIDESASVTHTNYAGQVLYANKNFCKVSGYFEHELVGQTLNIVNSGMHSSDFFKDFWITIKSGKIWRGIIENKTKDGSHYFLSTIIAPIKDLDNKIEKFVSIQYDVTKEVQDEKLLAKIQDVSRVGNWNLDLLTNKFSWSKMMGDLFPDALYDNKPQLEKFIGTIHPQDQEKWTQVYEKILLDGQPFKLTFRSLFNKKIYWFEMLGEATRDKNGTVILISGICRDITEIVTKDELLQVEKLKTLHFAKLASQNQ